MRDHNKLDVWQRSFSLCLRIYNLSATDKLGCFPKSEMFGLSSHIRKTAMSVPSNIAEGCGRESKKELFYFLNIACGSISELECQFKLSYELGYINQELFSSTNVEILKLERCLQRSWQSSRVT
jgi:four helix bundle protein